MSGCNNSIVYNNNNNNNNNNTQDNVYGAVIMIKSLSEFTENITFHFHFPDTTVSK